MFDPSDFLDLAREIGTKNEARIRTAVGRAYYASFLAIRNAIAIEEKTPEVHRKVLSMLYTKNAVIATKLHYLRRQRNIADYDTKLVMKAEDADIAVKLALEITQWRG
ncbi:MAG TPA: hypothetical protein VF360_06285 [Candidatus Methanoperedens sp.]